MRTSFKMLLATFCWSVAFAVFGANTGSIAVRCNKQSGTVSITASQATFNELVAAFSTNCQLDLFIDGVDFEQTFSCDIKDKPLSEAMSGILPADAHFYVVGADASAFAEKPRQGSKAGKRGGVPAGVGPQAQPPAAEIKASAIDKNHQYMDRQEKATGRTAMPKEVANPRAGQGEQQRQGTLPPKGYYYTMLLRATDKGYEPVSYQKVEGDLETNTNINGEVVYSIKDGSNVLHKSAFADPLVQHAYAKENNGVHRVLKSQEAYISVAIPQQAFEKMRTKTPDWEFFRLSDDMTKTRKMQDVNTDAPSPKLTRISKMDKDQLKKVLGN
jgi:hypothetical protein